MEGNFRNYQPHNLARLRQKDRDMAASMLMISMLLHVLSSFIIHNIRLQALRVVVVLLLASVRAGALGRALVVLAAALAVVSLGGLSRLGAGCGWWWLHGRRA
jgi:hypothetical protein